MMRIASFELERLQSVFEHNVEINLADSGVLPLSVGELLSSDTIETLLDEPLAYTQTNGTPLLRNAITTLYQGATEHNVIVTNGGAEANFISCWHLVEPGDEVIVMHPNYLQIHQLCEGFGAVVRPWHLQKHSVGNYARWGPDMDTLRMLVTARTKLIAVCNPNNPTGARLTASEVTDICAIADKHGTWILADEIYRGVEHDSVDSTTAWGHGERVIVTAGLSKAYGLPGLRIGWTVSDCEVAEALWCRRDYTTIAPSALSDRLARVALQPERHEALLTRARDIIVANNKIVSEWVDAHASLTLIPAEAGAIAFIGYKNDVGSVTLASWLREKASVLVAPGAHFGVDGYLRIGLGGRPELLRAGLERIGGVIADLRSGNYNGFNTMQRNVDD